MNKIIMELNELIKESTIELNVAAKDKEDLINKMIDVLVKDGAVLDKDKLKRIFIIGNL